MQSESTLFARIVEHIPGGVIVFSVDGRVRYVNSSTERWLRYARSELAGVPAERILTEAGVGRGWVDVQKEMLEGKSVDGTMLLVRSDGNEVLCTFRGFAIRDAANRPEELVLVFRDITEEHRSSLEIERKNIEMAKMNSELIRSNQELKRVSELKTNFLSIASHELKTPLTSIKGYSEIIIENMSELLDPAVRRMVESVNRAADRLHRVIDNMLDVTRIEQKRLRLRPEVLDLRAIARDCISDLEQFLEQRSIRIVCDLDESLPPFYGDRMRMQQVFTNLFSNALKYSPDSSTVELRIHREDETHIHVVVKDHGIGIDKSEQAKIFDAFYEVGSRYHHSSDSTKFLGGGTGLGLSIVKGIIERHGGRIWVVSEGVNRERYPGSEFHILLPLESQIPQDDDETKVIRLEEVQKPMPAEEDEESTARAEKKPSILLVDDDSEAVEIVKMILGGAFDIIVAETGEAGLAKAFQERPSMILLDLYLPGLDGCRISRLLRSQEETRNTPIAFFSAGTQNEEIQRAFASGADDFIVKPFGGRELLEKIWRLLMKKKEDVNLRAAGAGPRELN
jgi:PAS domain S-box-containing protein